MSRKPIVDAAVWQVYCLATTKKTTTTMSHDSSAHLIAGGIAGTMGAVLTCPLEVVKTRLQSSVASFDRAVLESMSKNKKSSSKKPPPSTTDNNPIKINYATGAAASNQHQQQCSSASTGASSGGGRRPAPARYFSLLTSLGPYARNSTANAKTNGSTAIIEDVFDNHVTSLNQKHHGSVAAAAANTPNTHSNQSSAAERQKRAFSFFRQNNLATHASPPKLSPSIWGCLKFIVETEGYRGLFKGLGPNIVGVAPSRAIYFWAYSQTKYTLNDLFRPESPIVHILAAGCAGFASSTLTNPIWMVKTRLQLDQRRDHGRLTVRSCVSKIYNVNGVRGFYKGIMASYLGISETVIHFVIYEALKAHLLQRRQARSAAHHSRSAGGMTTTSKANPAQTRGQRDPLDFFLFMMSASCSKATAATITYPHEVARTRLREEGDKYRGLVQTLVTVAREEGFMGLYRGLATHLIRQIPNTAITMVVYEAVVYTMTRANIDKIDDED